MKKIIAVSVLCLVAMIAVVAVSRSSYKSYYSGDAVNFQGHLLVASTDTGSLEIFKLNGSVMERSLKFKAPNSPLDKTDNFSSVKLNIENGRLFAYATSAYTLYKYDVTDLSRPVLFDKQKNTYWEWYNRVDIFGGKIVTVSDKSVKVWNSNANMLDVIDSYKIENDFAAAVRFEASGQYIITLNKDNKVRIYDTKIRSYASEFPVNFRDNNGLRKTYFDSVNRETYVFDDYYLKRFSFNGTLINSTTNSANQGYSVEPSGNSNYVYVANGKSVMRLDRTNFKNGSKVEANNLVAGAWAMDIKYVHTDSGEKLVIFNGNNISVVNSSLKKLASVLMTEEDTNPEIKEDLALSFNHNSGTPSATVQLSGNGFQKNEELSINFGGVVTKARSDSRGRFTQTLIVPDANRPMIDAKVDGAVSRLTYSTSFNVR